MKKSNKENVDTTSFKFNEAEYQARLESATVKFNNDVTNYDREVKPTFLAFTFAQKMALEGKMLSDNHIPKQGSDGFVMFFIGDKYKERFEALPAIVKEDYEKFLEEIKNTKISILEEQYYQESLKIDQEQATIADEERKKDAREKAKKTLLN